MSVTVVIIILFAFFFFFDYLPILKAKDKKTCWVYGVIYVSSFLALALYLKGIPIPSPLAPVGNFIRFALKLN